MNPPPNPIIICGAGIAGVATAYMLATRGARNILLLDAQPPLSLTSDKSTECYRDFWPGPGGAMVKLMARSIDILEELANASQNTFRMNRRGYLYITRTAQGADTLLQAAKETAELGAGPLRLNDPDYTPHAALEHAIAGADYLSDPALIRQHWPALAQDTRAVLHARRCGWLSAQQLGMYLLEQARALGVRFANAEVTGIDVSENHVTGVHLRSTDLPEYLATDCFINCAGPLLASVGRMMGIELPVFSERHVKLAFEDRLGTIPRHAPMLINFDPVTIPWSDEERELLAEEPETAELLGELPPGAHVRPEGEGSSPWVLALWAYDAHPVEEIFPPPIPEQFAEVVMRGVVGILPSLAPYIERPPRPSLDAGYYTKTRENRPLIGPLPVDGAYLLGALSGYGIMAACGAADLLASHILHEPLPSYASAFLPSRYADPAYQELLKAWGDTGQL